jgi:negative regulator of sigma E activity
MRYRLSLRDGLQILEGALAIGRQADGLAPEEVTTRLETVRQSAPPPTLAASSSKLAKIKAWFAPAG